LICQPDLGIRAIAWDKNEEGVASANNTVSSECVDWGAVQRWTKDHSFYEADELITTPEGKPPHEVFLGLHSPHPPSLDKHQMIDAWGFVGQLYRGPNTPPARCGE
jgi:hypothetical protein